MVKGLPDLLAIYAITTRMSFIFWHRIFMELDGLLSLECSGEQLVGLDILVEYLMPGGIGAPCTVKGILGLETNQVGRIIAHEFSYSVGISSGVLQLFYERFRGYFRSGLRHVLGIFFRIVRCKKIQIVLIEGLCRRRWVVWCS